MFNKWIDENKWIDDCYFQQSRCLSKNKVKIQFDLSNFAAKSDLNSATGNDISKQCKQCSKKGHC